MSKLANISSNPTLINFAQRAAQQATMPVADFIAPSVEVAIPTGFYKRYTDKSRFRVPDTRRPLHGRAAMIGSGAENVPYNLEPHALDYPIDQVEKLAEKDLLNSMQEGALILAESAGLAHEKRVVDAALAATGAGTEVTWSDAEDPIAYLDDVTLEVVKAAKYGSLMGVGIVFGAFAFKFVKNHPKVRSRFVVGNPKAGTTQTPTVENFGQLILGNPEVRASFMVYDDAPEGLDEDIQFVLDNTILVFARKQTPSRNDPSFMKTLRLMGQWMVPGSYQKEDGRGEVAKFDWHEQVVTTNASAGHRLNIKR
jgi:hypothetical protein